MKNSIRKSAAFAATSLVLLSQGVLANSVNFTSLDHRVLQVQSLEQAGQIKQAMAIAMNVSQSVAAQIGVDSVVASVQSKLNIIHQEVVTELHSEESVYSRGYRFHRYDYSAWDVSEFVMLNPEEKSQFPGLVKSDFRALQSQVRNYVLANQRALLYSKIFAAKALQLASKLSWQERNLHRDALAQMAQQAQKMVFLAKQTIEVCETVTYADRMSENGIEISKRFRSMQSVVRSQQEAYSDKACAVRSRATQGSDELAFSPELYSADVAIAAGIKAVGFKDVLQAEPEYFPTWGLNGYK